MAEVRELNLVANDAKKTPWTVAVLPDRLRFTSGDGTRVEEVGRSELGSRVELHDGGMLGRALLARIPKPVVLKLDEEALSVLSGWVGPLTREDLQVVLRRRTKWTIPVGALFIFGSLPMPGDPEAGIEALPLDPVGMVLGLGLIVLSLGARFRPHPVLLLLDGAWFLLLAADTLWSVVGEGRSVWWLAMVAFLVMAGIQPISTWRRFTAGG